MGIDAKIGSLFRTTGKRELDSNSLHIRENCYSFIDDLRLNLS